MLSSIIEPRHFRYKLGDEAVVEAVLVASMQVKGEHQGADHDQCPSCSPQVVLSSSALDLVLEDGSYGISLVICASHKTSLE